MVDVVVRKVVELESAPVTDPDKHAEEEGEFYVENDWDSEVLSVCLVQEIELGDEIDWHH